MGFCSVKWLHVVSCIVGSLFLERETNLCVAVTRQIICKKWACYPGEWDFVSSGDYTLSVALLVAYFWTRDKFMCSSYPSKILVRAFAKHCDDKHTSYQHKKRNAGAVNFNYQPSAGYLRRFRMFISSYKTEETWSWCCPVTWYVWSNRHFDGGKRAYLICHHNGADAVSFKLAMNMNISFFHHSFTFSMQQQPLYVKYQENILHEVTVPSLILEY